MKNFPKSTRSGPMPVFGEAGSKEVGETFKRITRELGYSLAPDDWRNPGVNRKGSEMNFSPKVDMQLWPQHLCQPWLPPDSTSTSDLYCCQSHQGLCRGPKVC